MKKREDKIRENPLVPHALLRRMYEGMVELRGLEPTAAGRRAGERGVRGEEACRASSLLSVGAGDLVSDVPGGIVGGKRQGGSRRSVLERFAPGAAVLRSEADTTERLTLAVGAASALRAQGAGRLVLAYVEGEALTAASWKQVLGAAGRAGAPIVIVLLPTINVKAQGGLSERAQSWGVPGMPVDAADAVALYRVMQESVLRARGGDGPSLVEGVTWQVAGTKTPPTDGVQAMRTLLEQRGLLSTSKQAAGAPKAARSNPRMSSPSYT